MPHDHKPEPVTSCELDRRDLLALAAALGGATLLPASRAHAAPVARLAGDFPQRPLLKADLSGLLDRKGLSKTVRVRRLLDDMETPGGWYASDVVKLEYTRERARSGAQSLRFRTLLRNEDYIRKTRSPNGSFTGEGVLFAGQPFSAFLSKTFSPPQDWSGFNRISMWCYVHPTLNPVNTLSIQFLCEGATAGPEDPISVHYWGDLRPGEWNHLTWEIPEMRRDKVGRLILFQPTSGVSVAGASPEIVYDFDELALEQVDAERVSGWSVAADEVAYCHLGYQPNAAKVAIAAVGPGEFTLTDAGGGSVVATLPAREVETRHGRYSLLDFSAVSQPGRYRLRYGGAVTAPFEVGEAVWRPLIEATLNAFYGLRCGFAVEGAHDACHLDVYAEYMGERRVVGGGWHDAANLTQGPYRTHLSIYALLKLHDQLQQRDEPELARRALEEARWGLEWSLRCRYAPGVRVLYGDYSYWTDSKPGTLDDVIQAKARDQVGSDVFQNTLAALATARASRTLKASDPAGASTLLRCAEEDYSEVVKAVRVPTNAPALEINVPSWRDQIGYLTLTATELYRATSDARYARDAARFGRLLVQVQERRFVQGIPVAGYFYEDAGRTRIVHEYHNSFEDCGLLAFAELCEALPDHPDWMEWYAGLTLYAEAFCHRGSQAAAPFGTVPAAVWRRADLTAPLPPDDTGQRLARLGPTPVFPTPPTPEMIQAQMQRMFEAGLDLGADHRLRVFPLWSDHIRHGASTVQLSKAVGLAACAAAMGSAELSALSARQLQWAIGANPLGRSVIYGVGHDYWQNFTVSLPNLVGGMSLGFNSYTDDAPAWGNNAVFPYKEQWVYSSCRIAHNLVYVGMPARVSGHASTAASFRCLKTGREFPVAPGAYAVTLPAGDYLLQAEAFSRRVTLAHGEDRRLDLDPASAIALDLTAHGAETAAPRLELLLDGRGVHRLESRLFNARLKGLPQQVRLEGQARKVELAVEIVDPAMMWIAAVVADGDLKNRVEAYGATIAMPTIQTQSG